MDKRLAEMDKIMRQKDKDIDRHGVHPLNPEGIALAEDKRFTFDIIQTPVDPLR